MARYVEQVNSLPRQQRSSSWCNCAEPFCVTPPVLQVRSNEEKYDM